MLDKAFKTYRNLGLFFIALTILAGVVLNYQSNYLRFSPVYSVKDVEVVEVTYIGDHYEFTDENNQVTKLDKNVVNKDHYFPKEGDTLKLVQVDTENAFKNKYKGDEEGFGGLYYFLIDKDSNEAEVINKVNDERHRRDFGIQ